MRYLAIGGKLSAVGVSLALITATPVVFAGEEEDPLVEVQELFERGQNAFEAFDYERAINNWVDALGTLPEGSEYNAMRSMILYAIASARLDAFDSDGDIKHLRHAKRLLGKYRSEQDPKDTETLALVDEYLQKLNTKLAEHDASARSSADGPEGASDQSAQPEPLPTESMNSLVATGDPSAPVGTRSLSGGQGKGLVISGAVLGALGVGIAGGGGTAFGLKTTRHSTMVDEVFQGNKDELTFDQAMQEFDDGRSAQTLQIASFATGGVLLAAGAALMIVGFKRRKSVDSEGSEGSEGSKRNIVVAPSLGRRNAGVSLIGRF